MRIILQTLGRGRLDLEVEADVSVAKLRAAAAAAGNLALERTKLVCAGRVLEDADGSARLGDGATVFALAAPVAEQHRAPVQPSAAPVASSRADEHEDDAAPELRLERLDLHPLARRCAQRLVTGGVPEALLAVLLSIRLRALLLFLAWCIASRLAAAHELGPPFVLFSCLAAMFLNLGARKPGELSAYSLFNPGLRPLPGAMEPEELERQMRAGLR